MATGVVEGACTNLIEDKSMDRLGDLSTHTAWFSVALRSYQVCTGALHHARRHGHPCRR